MPVRRILDRAESPKPRAENYAEQVRERVTEFEAAFTQWQTEYTSDQNGGFSLGWLRSQGYQGLAKWIYKYNALEDLLDRSNPAIREHLTEKRGYTPEYVQEKFSEAHTAWQKIRGGIFDREWLRNNGYSGLERYISDNVDWPTLVEQLPSNIQDDFELHTQRYDLDAAIVRFKEAYAAWKQLPAQTRPEFTTLWLRENGYSGVESYLRKNYGDFGMIAILAGDEVMADFKDQYNYTEGIALDDLRSAYFRWRNEDEAMRGDFNVVWLLKHGYGGLYNWANAHYDDGIIGLVKQISYIREDFHLRGESRD